METTLRPVFLDDIQSFFAPRKLVLAGVSRDSKKFGHYTYKALKEKGFDLCLVHPEALQIDGTTCVPSLSLIPEGYDRLVVMLPPDKTNAVLVEAARCGITKVWVQQTSDNDSTKQLASELGLELIDKKCIHMYAGPVTGMHKFHRKFWQWFGLYAKSA